MKRSRIYSIAAVATYRPVVARISLGLLVAASLGLLIVAKTNSNSTRTLRMMISDTLTPVVEVLGKPMEAVANAGRWVHEMAALREDNLALRRDNSELKQWQTVATEMESENAKLRALLKFAPSNKSAYTSARVAADAGSPYSRSAIITSGEKQGVREDLAVINDSGLVGRVLEVGSHTSRILLLTDVNSRIPVLSENSRERSIASGTGNDALSLLYLPENSKIAVGEKIVTSGDGGVMAPGLPVGVVTSIDKGIATIKPYVDWYHLEYVSVVDFSM